MTLLTGVESVEAWGSAVVLVGTIGLFVFILMAALIRRAGCEDV